MNKFSKKPIISNKYDLLFKTKRDKLVKLLTEKLSYLDLFLNQVDSIEDHKKARKNLAKLEELLKSQGKDQRAFKKARRRLLRKRIEITMEICKRFKRKKTESFSFSELVHL